MHDNMGANMAKLSVYSSEFNTYPHTHRGEGQ